MADDQLLGGGDPAAPSGGGIDSFFWGLLRTMKKTQPMKNDKVAATIALRLLLGLNFLSGIRGESMTLNPNCSRFRAIISLSTSCPYRE